MRKTIAVVAVLLAVFAALASGGCTRVKLAENPQTAVHTDTASIPLGSAAMLDANVEIGVGELALSGETSSTDALGGTFRYAPASWKPEVKYSVEGTVGKLSVRQPESSGIPAFGASENTWKLKLAGGVPTNLAVQLGVGESTVDLRGVDVRELDVLTGVGKATIDLSGARTADMGGAIECGVGEVIVRLPKSTGVRVTGGEDGVGDLRADGFTTQDGGLANVAWRSGTGPKIDIRINRGIGDITLELVD